LKISNIREVFESFPVVAVVVDMEVGHQRGEEQHQTMVVVAAFLVAAADVDMEVAVAFLVVVVVADAVDMEVVVAFLVVASFLVVADAVGMAVEELHREKVVDHPEDRFAAVDD
jgi:Zn-dependent membrane protease YugP